MLFRSQTSMVGYLYEEDQKSHTRIEEFLSIVENVKWQIDKINANYGDTKNRKYKLAKGLLHANLGYIGLILYIISRETSGFEKKKMGFWDDKMNLYNHTDAFPLEDSAIATGIIRSKSSIRKLLAVPQNLYKKQYYVLSGWIMKNFEEVINELS